MAASDLTDRFNGVIASLAIKVRCVLGATTNIPFVSGAPSGITNPYDGVFIVDGDRVLLTGQTNPIENGVWCASASGPWVRAQDWDGNRDVELGSTVWAGQQTGLDILWQVTAPNGIIQPGTTAVTIIVLFNPGAPSSASLADVTLVGSDTLGQPITISQGDPILSLKDSTNLFSQATGRVQWLDSSDAEVARIAVASTELILTTINGGIEILPAGGNAVTLGYALQLEEMNSVIAPAATFGRLWLRDDSPNVLVFTDGDGGETVLGAPGSTGSAGGITYIFDSNVGGTDPGATFFRTNTGNPLSVTQFRFSDLDVNSVDVQNIIGNMVVGGYFIMRNAVDNTQFRVYAITSIVDNAGWYTINVNYLNAQSSGDNPIVNGAEILFEFFVSAMLAPAVNTGNQSPFALWDAGDTRYESSNTLISANKNSPPLGGRLQLGTTSGYSTTSPQIMRPLGAADTVMDYVYGTDANNGFLQGYRRVAGEMNFGARIASVNTDMLTFDLLANVRIEAAASFKIEETGVAAADLAGHGQLWVNSADDSLNYQTEAGVNFDLTAGGGAVTQIVDGAANIAVIAEGAGIIGVRSVGNTDAEDRRLTWEYQDGTIRASIGQEFFTDLIFRNHIAGRHMLFNCGTGGSSRIRLHLDGTSATGGVSLYAGTSATPRLATANEGVRIQNGTLFLAEQAAQELDDAGFGQLFVDSADDSLHYITEAGVDFDLTAGGGATTFAALTDTDVAGVADHDMLFFDTASGDWKDTAGLLTADVDGATIGLVVNNVTSAKDGAIVINDGVSVLQSLRLATDSGIPAATITTPLIGGLDIWMSPRNGARDIILKAREVWIAGAIPSTDHVAFSDDDVDFNTVGSSKVDWNISGFSGAIRIVGPNLGLADTDQLMFGTSDDVTMAYDGVSALDLNLITDDVFHIQEAGVDRFGFNHLNNRFELFTGNRLLAYSSDNLEWMEYYHDGSDGHISTGGTNPGSIILESAIVHTVPTDTVSANAVTLATEDSNGFFVDLEPATAAVVITLGGSPPSGYYVASIRVQQDGATAQTISFAGGVILDAGGTPHPVTTTLDGITIYTVETWDGGTTWHISGVDYS